MEESSKLALGHLIEDAIRRAELKRHTKVVPTWLAALLSFLAGAAFVISMTLSSAHFLH